MTMSKKIKWINTDKDELQNVVGDVVDKKFKEFNQEKDKKSQIEHILKEKAIRDQNRLNKPNTDNKDKEHDHKSDLHETCPSCSTKLQDIGEGIEYCPDCNNISMPKKVYQNKDYLICADCGGFMPRNYLDDPNSKCPKCGGTKVYDPKNIK